MVSGRRIAALFAAFLAVGLLMVIPSLGNPWFWDDLHWFRPYSFDEIASTWTGINDPARIEVPGYRPLHALTNQAFYEVFGEHASGVRLAAVAFLALALALMGETLVLLGLPAAVVVAGGLLALTARNMTYTYAWASEAYQAVHMAAFGAAALTALVAVRARRPRLAAVSIGLWVVTLFVKDQGVLVLPALLLVVAFAAGAGIRRDRLALTYAAVATGIAAADFVARAVFVPETAADGYSLNEFAHLVADAAAFPGGASDLPMALLVAALAAAGAWAWWRRGDRDPLLVAMAASLVAAVASCLYGLEDARTDLTYFPLYFFGVYVCCAAALVLRRVGGAGRTAALAVCGAAFAGSVGAAVHASYGAQEAMSGDSIQTLGFNYDLIYGVDAGAPMPERRRRAAQRDLARVGVRGRVRTDYLMLDLYCQELADPSRFGTIPRAYAFDQTPPTPRSCRRP
jgi:hypothetical protein